MPARLAIAQRIVDEAAVLALASFRSRSALAVRSKQPQDFVSEVDEQVERLIRTRLAAAFPGEAVLGEEFGGVLSGADWIIDPIDGTSNFLRGIPLWAISLGFVKDGRAEAGVIAMPALGWTVGAEAGAGLFLNGRPVQRDESFSAVSIMSLGDATNDIETVAAMAMKLRRAGWVVESYRTTATAMAFAALGHLDGHLQETVKIWDMAAGLALCAEAGLLVRHGPLDQADNAVFSATPALMAAADIPASARLPASHLGAG